MKKLLIMIMCSIILLGITGCSEEKNIFHSRWVSRDGYRLAIADPDRNSEISNPGCIVKMDNDELLGKCYVKFDKDNGTIKLKWIYGTDIYNHESDAVIISNSTEKFTLNGQTFIYDSNLKTNQ